MKMHSNIFAVCAVLVFPYTVVGCGEGKSSSGQDASASNNNNAFLPPFCGDGIQESNPLGHEDCDATDLNGHTCTSLGWKSGTLKCNDLCRFDTSACTGPHPCGNGVIDYGETCDGTNLNGFTCETLSGGDRWVGGTLSCARDCYFNTLNCIRPSWCGNGILEQGLGGEGEQCDDGEENSDTEPDACRTSCFEAYCGDGVIDTGEVCDDGPENSDIFPDACRLSDCHPARCGDDVKDTEEQCDGPQLGGESCISLGFSSGDLQCSTDCTFDTSGCQP
jgi:hypothetical protein